MAPQIQPGSLYNLSLSCVSNLIDQACTTIFLEYGSYGNEECLDAIKKLQRHLMATLPLSVFEHLSEDRNSSNRNSYQGANQLLIWSKDPRIKLGVFLHPALTKFSVDGRGNELMLLTQQDDFHGSCCSYMGGLDELFWCSHLRRLVNIVSLNLNLITTDEILHLIGANCLKLEIVNIVSRIKQDNVQSYLMSSSDTVGEGQADGGQYIGQFPGISLKFCVTDVGLLALLNCTQLKSITMNKIVNHSPANHGITLQGVRTLVFGLPNLEFISFGSMGKVLSQDFDAKIKGIANKRKRPTPLKLTHFNEMDPSFMDVHRLEVTCPNIQHLSLALPITIHSNGLIDANTSPCVTILEALSKSSLPLRILELQHFPFCDAFKQLLVAKGNDLRELLFRAATPVDSQHLTFIGESCPNLQKLHIKDLGPENGQQDDAGGEGLPIFSFLHHRSDLFSSLVSLHLSGRFWNPHIILPLVLSSATKISKISLLNMTFRTVMDKALVKVMQANKLSAAASISLYSGCFLSIELLRRLIFGCDKLTCFSFSQSENLDLNDVDRLKLEVASKNLDIKLCCLEMLNF